MAEDEASVSDSKIAFRSESLLSEYPFVIREQDDRREQIGREGVQNRPDPGVAFGLCTTRLEAVGRYEEMGVRTMGEFHEDLLARGSSLTGVKTPAVQRLARFRRMPTKPRALLWEYSEKAEKREADQ